MTENNVLSICPLCEESVDDDDDFQKLGQKGIDKLLQDRIVCEIGQLIHKECRKNYSKVKVKPASLDQPVNSCLRQLRSETEESAFDFRSMCFLCGTCTTVDSEDTLCLRSFDCQYRICQTAIERKDDWGNEVTKRISHAIDLPAADAMYHQTCNVNFRTLRNIPKKYSPHTNAKQRSLGRPKDEERWLAFHTMLDWVENNEDETITVPLLQKKMKELSNLDDEPYSNKYLKQKLKEHYGEDVIFIEISGKPTIVTLQNKVNRIIDSFYDMKRSSPEDEKRKIILTAAQLIRNDIKQMSTLYVTEEYPSTKKMDIQQAETDQPESLKQFLDLLIPGKKDVLKKKKISIAQVIMQAAFPRKLMMPLQLGLAVHLHDYFASRYLIDTLHVMGFTRSYKEVRKYEMNAALMFNDHDLQIENTQKICFMADNVDHDPANLDGRNTVHWMGMTLAVAPPNHVNRVVPRLEVSNDEIANLSSNMIQTFNSEGAKTFGGMKYDEFTIPMNNDVHKNLDILWKCKQIVSPNSPLWGGFMQASFGTSKDLHSSSIIFLPMIDLPPTDLTCVYSTLKYIEHLADKYHRIPVCTFDQALWWKALQVLKSPNCDIKTFIVRLGEFHTRMNFLGCIGYIMANTGLTEALELVYAGNTVPHLLTGKAIDRSWRAHQLVDITLNTLLLKDIIESEDVSIVNIENLIKDILEGNSDLSIVDDSSDINILKRRLDEKKQTLKQNRTANFWLQYLDLIDILKEQIRAERLGNWKMHLEVMAKMLPYFAACGHNNYTKSVWLYLQQMSLLEENYPNIFLDFMQGFHVIRRNKSRVWAAVSPDQVIEQTLMRSVKTPGGLTHGTGFGKVQRNTYIFARPACAEISSSMQDFTGVKFVSSDQHKDAGESRIARDNSDIKVLTEFFQVHNPFSEEKRLKNIVTGQVANEAVNVDRAAEVGAEVLKMFKDEKVSELTFKTSWKAVNMAHKLNITSVSGEIVSVDPNLLFQRLTAIATNNKTDLEDVFTFELCPYPAPLASSTTDMLSPDKPKLVEGIQKFSSTDFPGREREAKYILDGGDLLYKMGDWKKHKTYQDIADQCASYVKKHYGIDSIVVFDGYPQKPTTKDPAHLLRTKDIGIGPVFQITPNAKLSVKKNVFLSNTKNKQNIINLIGESLENCGITVRRAAEDADLLIAKTAMEYSRSSYTVVIGEDTDVLVLLLHYCETGSLPLVYQTSNRRWDIHHLVKMRSDITGSILLQHAFLGCDTVSRIFGIGKGKIMNNNRLLNICKEVAEAFYSPASTKDEINAAGTKLLLAIYNKKNITTLNKLRYKIFMEKICGNSAVKPEQLPPTEDSAHQHFLRVYHQVQVWLGHSLDPLQYSWRIEKGMLMPLFTTKPPASPELLKYIRCGCKEDGCQDNKCTCMKLGVPCSLSCSKCNGVTCGNPPKPDLDDNI